MAILRNLAENAATETRIRILMGQEEHDRVQAAEAFARHNGNSVRNAEANMREHCAKLCDAFPDNLMAKHLAKLIRSGA